MSIYRRSFLAGLALLGTILTAPAALAADIRQELVREAGIVGELRYPVGAKHKTTVIMLNGSDGGTPSARDADDLAKAGYTVLALAYFKDWNGQPDGLPTSLNEIPLEYFFRAIDWLKTRPQVDRSRIVLMGQSRGGELVLLLASMRRDIAGVVAFSPSSRVWSGVPAQGALQAPLRPAWTLGGRPVPYQGEPNDKVTSMRQWFEQARPVAAARIPVENIRGPVLLVSSKVDTIWPAAAYSDEIAARLATRRREWPVRNLQFDDASHLLMGGGPGFTKLEIPGTTYTFDFGGTPEGNADARQRAWTATKRFIGAI